MVLLARLAVDQRIHGRGLGGFLLRDAMTRSLDLSEKLGIHAVIVDALDAEAKTSQFPSSWRTWAGPI